MSTAKINGVSMGEKRVKAVLNKRKINYCREVKFEDCINEEGSKLSFDFSIKDGEGKLLGLIEFQGVQHYINTFTDKAYEHTLKNDKTKVEYCKANNIPLLAIPYYKFDDIEELVKAFLKQIGIKSKSWEVKNEKYKTTSSEDRQKITDELEQLWCSNE